MNLKAGTVVRLNEGTVATKRAEIKQNFLSVVALEESLYSLLKSEESFYIRSNPLRHPLIFYFGHTFTFFANKFYNSKLIDQRVSPELEAVFAIGVDEMSWDDLNESNIDWPPLQVVKDYRSIMKELVLNVIESTPLDVPIGLESPIWAVLMGIEHLRIHIETSSVLIRQLSLSHVTQNPQWAPCVETGTAPENELLNVAGGLVKLGKSADDPRFGWDNEYGEHCAQLVSFSAAKYLVSNFEYKEFVDSQGYVLESYWTEEGWAWKEYNDASQPEFWMMGENGSLSLRLVDREVSMPLDWPVEVNYHEAHAFCSWKSKSEQKDIRMPTEDEWTLLHEQEAVANLGDWQQAPGNINLEHFNSPCPVNSFRGQNFYDVIGNVWQWTETPIYPLDQFKVHPLYDDFSVPTFDGKHNLMKGGSWISTGNEACKEARYAFRRHFYQHAGFRYVASENRVDVKTNPYETDFLLSQYSEFHYGDEHFNIPNFPKACITEAAKYFDKLPKQARALDIGCALGRSTLELGKYFTEVVGLDFSARFVERAQTVCDDKSIRYTLPTEGKLGEYTERRLASMGLDSLSASISFFQADACNLPKKYCEFDLVFAGNLIDRLISPSSFLQSMIHVLNKNGLLVLTSPYTWLEEYTQEKEWLGGYLKNGEAVRTLTGLKEVLSPQFDLLEVTDIPFVIRETARKFQHTISEMTVWQLRS